MIRSMAFSVLIFAATTVQASDLAAPAIQLCAETRMKPTTHGAPKGPVVVVLKSTPPDGPATDWSYDDSYQFRRNGTPANSSAATVACIEETFEKIGVYSGLLLQPAFTRKWEARLVNVSGGTNIGRIWIESLPPLEISNAEEAKGARPTPALERAFEQIAAAGKFFPFATRAVRFAANGTVLMGGGVLREIDTVKPRFERDWKFADALALSEDATLAAVYDVSKGRGSATIRRIEVWDLTAGKRVRDWKIDETAEQLVFSDDLRHVAAVTPKDVRIWERESGRQVGSFPRDGIAQIEFLQDGRLLAAGRTTAIHEISGARAETLESLVRITRLALSADGRRMALRTPEDVSVVTVDGALIRRFPGRTANTLALSPDGRRLATAGDDGVVLWDVAEGRELARLDTVNAPEVVVFSTDGRRLLATSRASNIDRLLGKQHEAQMNQLRVLGGSKPRVWATPILWSWDVSSK